ncbi:hypothetical protein [Longimicrobium sp.]|uniref:hypothetical protein n=1 Tax=Longimicrobium sp. TaxID=2029185 RepID=UPI002E37C673|nr:hypothetical protein [Longimicrobium sp.]HEX6041376.1 hypothetical protein [Longimicrobium sp.]
MAAVACLLAACGSAEQAPVEDEAVVEEPCGPARIVVTAVPADSFSTADRCALVGLAMRMLGSAGPETGLMPEDTAAAETARLVPIQQRDPRSDSIVASRWQVSVGLRGRPYDAELLVDRNTGRVRITRIHK